MLSFESVLMGAFWKVGFDDCMYGRFEDFGKRR